MNKTVYICDLCKKECSMDRHKMTIIYYQNESYIESKDKDLCHECYVKIEEVLCDKFGDGVLK